MKKLTYVGKLVNYERKNNSYYGNPKYYGYFENDTTGEALAGTTGTDSACAYGFLNNIDCNREVTYHVTRTGNVIIDYVKVIKK